VSRRSTAAPRVLYVAPMPPPVHGLAEMSERVAARLGERIALDEIDLTIAADASGYGFQRVAVHVAMLFRIVRHRMRRGRVVYYQLPGGPTLVWAIAAIVLTRPLGLRFIGHHHSALAGDARSRLFGLLFRVSSSHACHVFLCPCLAGAARLRSDGSWTSAVCSNAWAVAPHAQEGHARASGGRIVLGFLSNLLPGKGVDLALAVHHRLRARGVDVTLEIAGRPVDEAIAELVRRAADDDDTIVFHGVIDAAERAAFFERIDALLFPSTYVHEAQPLTVLEALASGTFVIATDVGCLTAMLGDDGVGGVTLAASTFVEAATEHVVGLHSRTSPNTHERGPAERFELLRAEALEQLADLERLVISAAASAPQALAQGDRAPI
jgi:glycosyltransferase involved in cell wall biosynthesis